MLRNSFALTSIALVQGLHQSSPTVASEVPWSDGRHDLPTATIAVEELIHRSVEANEVDAMNPIRKVTAAFSKMRHGTRAGLGRATDPAHRTPSAPRGAPEVVNRNPETTRDDLNAEIMVEGEYPEWARPLGEARESPIEQACGPLQVHQCPVATDEGTVDRFDYPKPERVNERSHHRLVLTANRL
jgi:hypothetical protein